jgi:hypothetical protein
MIARIVLSDGIAAAVKSFTLSLGGWPEMNWVNSFGRGFVVIAAKAAIQPSAALAG